MDSSLSSKRAHSASQAVTRGKTASSLIAFGVGKDCGEVFRARYQMQAVHGVIQNEFKYADRKTAVHLLLFLFYNAS